jgi:hypothetical protein
VRENPFCAVFLLSFVSLTQVVIGKMQQGTGKVTEPPLPCAIAAACSDGSVKGFVL